MTRISSKFTVATVIIAVTVAMPLVINHQGQLAVREKSEFLRQQALQLEQLMREKDRLTRLANDVKARQLTDEQLTELLRLRSEAGQLRRQVGAIQKLREDNQRQQISPPSGQTEQTPMSQAELDEAFATEIASALKNITAELQPTLQRFAMDHSNQVPEDFPALLSYFPTSNVPILGLHLFGFVRDTEPTTGDNLILRETGMRQNPDGKWRRTYAFKDGRTVEVISDDGNFEQWERQQLTPLPNVSR